MKLQNPKDSAIIESPFDSHSDAAAKLNERISAGEFRDATFATSIATSKCYSASQAFWLHKLAMGRQPQVAVANGLDMSGLKAIFAKASAHLKYPAILLAVGDAIVKLSLAGPRSQHQGQVMVTSPKYGDAYYGRVDHEGNFYQGKDNSPAVQAMVRRMSEDPVATAKEFARLTGKCCFCGLTLKDERSTSVGYGSTCADHFGLPWGNVIRNRASE